MVSSTVLTRVALITLCVRHERECVCVHFNQRRGDGNEGSWYARACLEYKVVKTAKILQQLQYRNITGIQSQLNKRLKDGEVIGN